MKKALITSCIVVLYAVAITFVVCAIIHSLTPQENNPHPVSLISSDLNLTLWQDDETGVQYIVSSRGMCPRLNKDGTLYIESSPNVGTP